MKRFLRNHDGAVAFEYALVIPFMMLFVAGICQTAYILCIDNMLHYSVDFAARCAAIQSTASPCNGPDMITPATHFFPMANGSTFATNTSSCSGKGLIGTYQVSTFPVEILREVFGAGVTLTARSCYP
jgi:Flp pilus assembly protein TadG